MSVSTLLASDAASIVGQLAAVDRRRAGSDARLEHRQTLAWERQIAFLQAAFTSPVVAGSGMWPIVFEFDIPRRGKRIDVVLIATRFIAVLEFKTGGTADTSAALKQAEDYVAELSDFHAGSRDRPLVPIVVAPSGSRPIVTTPAGLAERLIEEDRRLADCPSIDADAWLAAPYAPTPTIIEAACHLYANHSVTALARSDAEAINLTRTQDAIARAIDDARRERRRIACFVTGVPGAGKTLAGLNAAVRSNVGEPVAVYLSGNGPLVAVLGEALARDESSRTGVAREASRRRAGQFVQNVHRFIDHHLPKAAPAAERVVVFDEAQRAWSASQAKRKYGRDESEPASMLRILDRHDWSVMVGLVGGGQEINTGEAGLAEWGRAIEDGFPHWEVRVAPALLHV